MDLWREWPTGCCSRGVGPGHIVGRSPKGRARAMADTISGEEDGALAPVYPGLGVEVGVGMV